MRGNARPGHRRLPARGTEAVPDRLRRQARAAVLRPLAVPAEAKALVVAAGSVACAFSLAWLLVSRVRAAARILEGATAPARRRHRRDAMEARCRPSSWLWSLASRAYPQVWPCHPPVAQEFPDQLAPDQEIPDQVVPDQVVPDQVVPDQVVPDQMVPFHVPPDHVVPAADARAMAAESNGLPKMSVSGGGWLPVSPAPSCWWSISSSGATLTPSR